jgi:hypothetical protein
MPKQFDLSGTQVFAMASGESFTLVTLDAKQVYRVQNEGPATINLDWDEPPAPGNLSLEAGRSVDLRVSRLNVSVPSSEPSGIHAVGWYRFLG